VGVLFFLDKVVGLLILSGFLGLTMMIFSLIFFISAFEFMSEEYVEVWFG
jgi:hypothetical protein